MERWNDSGAGRHCSAVRRANPKPCPAPQLPLVWFCVTEISQHPILMSWKGYILGKTCPHNIYIWLIEGVDAEMNIIVLLELFIIEMADGWTSLLLGGLFLKGPGTLTSVTLVPTSCLPWPWCHLRVCIWSSNGLCHQLTGSYVKIRVSTLLDGFRKVERRYRLQSCDHRHGWAILSQECLLGELEKVTSK